MRGKRREESGDINSEAFCSARDAWPKLIREDRTGGQGRQDEQELILKVHEALLQVETGTRGARAPLRHGSCHSLATACPCAPSVVPGMSHTPSMVLGMSTHHERDCWRVHTPRAWSLACHTPRAWSLACHTLRACFLACPQAPSVVPGVSTHPESDHWRVHRPQAWSLACPRTSSVVPGVSTCPECGPWRVHAP